AVYSQGEVVPARYSCTDSELASCVGPVPPGSPIGTHAVGHHTFTVTAADQAGNQSSLTRHYTVYAADGSGQMTVVPSTVNASAAHQVLRFGYMAASGGVLHGALTLVVPAGWSAPSL